MATNAVGSNPPSGRTILERLKTVDGAGSGLDADLVDGLSSGDFGGSGLWTPPAVNIGAGRRQGASQVNSAGAGWALRFSRGGNQWLHLQVALNVGGLTYDGADITPVVHWGFRDAPGPGDNVIWSVKYVLIRVAADDPDAALDGSPEDTIDVSARAADRLHLDTLTSLTGKVGAVLLNLSIGRRSLGAGSDTFDEHVYLHGLTLTRT